MSNKWSKDFPCNHLEHLPCIFGFLDKDIYRCSFNAKYVQTAWIDGNYEESQALLKQACPPIIEDFENDRPLVEISNRYRNKSHSEVFLKNAKEGDIVFDTYDFSGNGEVLLIKKCESDGSQCIVRNSIGREYWVKPSLLRIIKNRDHFMEHLVQSEDEANEIKCKAIQVGLTCNFEKNKSGYLITIQGSSKGELDDFLMLVLNNDFFSLL